MEYKYMSDAILYDFTKKSPLYPILLRYNLVTKQYIAAVTTVHRRNQNNTGLILQNGELKEMSRQTSAMIVISTR